MLSVDVFADEAVNLSSYDVVVEVVGGHSGRLTLESVVVDQQRPDFLFAGMDGYLLVMDKAKSNLIGLNHYGGATRPEQAYLGTFNFRPSKDARGPFEVVLYEGDGTVSTVVAVKSGRPTRTTRSSLEAR